MTEHVIQPVPSSLSLQQSFSFEQQLVTTPHYDLDTLEGCLIRYFGWRISTLLIDVMATACSVGGIYRTSELNSRFACTALRVWWLAGLFTSCHHSAWYAAWEHLL